MLGISGLPLIIANYLKWVSLRTNFPFQTYLFAKCPQGEAYSLFLIMLQQSTRGEGGLSSCLLVLHCSLFDKLDFFFLNLNDCDLRAMTCEPLNDSICCTVVLYKCQTHTLVHRNTCVIHSHSHNEDQSKNIYLDPFSDTTSPQLLFLLLDKATRDASEGCQEGQAYQKSIVHVKKVQVDEVSPPRRSPSGFLTISSVSARLL